MTLVWTGGKLKVMQISLFGRRFFCSWSPSIQPDRQELQVFQAGLDKLHDLVVITEVVPAKTPTHRIVYVNEAFENHTGYSRREVIGRSPGLLQGPDSQETELSLIGTALRDSKPVHAELINYKKDGTLFWIELDIAPIKDTQNVATHWVSVARDITLRKSTEQKIEYLAFYDPLTQLPNRRMLMDRLEHALTQNKAHTGREPGKIYGALMFIDLDNFKALNDTLGHATGDLLLRKVASRLGSCVRSSDTVARLGGDEFVVMLESLPNDVLEASDYSRDVAQRILLALSEPYDLAGIEHESTCSIGLTMFSKRKQNLGDLLKQADLAMYQAKASGRNALCFFYPAMQAAAMANAALNLELRQSLRQGDFMLYYQPQVGREGHMFSVEALLRWEHPTRGLVYPDEFIPQAEESGLILQLGQWALETACAQLALWALRAETRHLSISVNVSVRQFKHPEFVELVMKTIKNAGVDANRLDLELTESLLAKDMDVTIAKMGMLQGAGVTLSIDDFGIGYSALSSLKYLPLNQLKIDRAFVKDILTDPNDAAIARTIIGLAQSLGLGVVAEGVETVAQRDLLSRFGCHSYQGYLFCRALPIDELEVFMKQLAPAALAA